MTAEPISETPSSCNTVSLSEGGPSKESVDVTAWDQVGETGLKGVKRLWITI